MDEEKYSAITSQLGALERKLKPKLGGPGFIVIGCRCRFPAIHCANCLQYCITYKY
jgi:hypothetical protein